MCKALLLWAYKKEAARMSEDVSSSNYSAIADQIWFFWKQTFAGGIALYAVRKVLQTEMVWATEVRRWVWKMFELSFLELADSSGRQSSVEPIQCRTSCQASRPNASDSKILMPSSARCQDYLLLSPVFSRKEIGKYWSSRQTTLTHSLKEMNAGMQTKNAIDVRITA